MISTLFYAVCALLLLMQICIPAFGTVLVMMISGFERWKCTVFSVPMPIAFYVQTLFLTASVIWHCVTKDPLEKRLLPALSLFALVALLSVPFSIEPASAFRALPSVWMNVMTAYYIAFFIATSSSKHVSNLQVRSVLFVSFFLAFIQLVVGEGKHVSAGFQDWNYFAIVLVVLLPFLFSRFYSAMNMGGKLQNGLWILLSLLFIVETGSRSGLALLVIALCLLVVNGYIKREVVWGGLGLCALGIFIAMVGGLFGFWHPFRALHVFFTSPHFQERAQNGILSLMTVSKHPFTGVGVGMYETYSQWAYPNLPFQLTPVFSSFTTILAEMGIVGGLAYLYLFLHAANLVSGVSDTNVKRLLMISICLIGLASLVYTVHTHLFTWCYLGWIYGVALQHGTPLSNDPNAEA